MIYNDDSATPNPDLDKIETTSLTLGAADDISGGDGADIAFGGKGDDLLLGDDLLDGTAGLVGNDILVGDNGIIEYFSPARIRTTDTSSATGGADTIRGNRGNDVILGGVNGSSAGDKLSGEEGDDVILGDNGVVVYNDNANPDLDRVETTDFSLGGADEISGGAGRDFVLGGTGADLILGDDALGGGAAAGGDDILIGDQGKILLTNNVVTSIETTDTGAGDGGIDEIYGNGGADVALGGVAGDKISGDGGNDILVGDQGKILLANNLFTSIETTDDDASDGAADVIHGNDGADVALGGVGADEIFGDAGNDILLGDEGDVVFNLAADWAETATRQRLDRIRTTKFTLGTGDQIFGGADNDIALGGTGADLIVGDNSIAGAAPEAGGCSRAIDILIGDQGEILLQTTSLAASRRRMSCSADGAADEIHGNGGADVALGGVGCRQDLRRRRQGHPAR